jgi:hypothetical protein
MYSASTLSELSFSLLVRSWYIGVAGDMPSSGVNTDLLRRLLFWTLVNQGRVRLTVQVQLPRLPQYCGEEKNRYCVQELYTFLLARV